MKKVLYFSIISIFVAAITGLSHAEPSVWIDLFNGKDLTGWSGVNETTFDVHEGNLRLVKGMGWLKADQVYDDFVLEFECKPLVEKFDSGLFFHSNLEGKPWPSEGFQINLRFDGFGTLVRGRQPMRKSDFEAKIGEWYKFRFETEGENARLEVNGEELWEADFIDPQSGLIGIQAENRAYEFRNMRIQEIGYTNLLEGEEKTFKHLAVHAGPKDIWSLKDGILACQGEGGGWIGTKTGDYSDFILKLDYRVPKEGNSGVYIRRPKDGDGAYTGMEIQVIDDDAKHWGELKSWQLTGSIYHEVSPSVDATKEAGNWQTMMIKAVKNNVQIYNNGVLISDTNLDENEKLKTRPRKGFIGFQNYDGHIEYRNVRVKRIEE